MVETASFDAAYCAHILEHLYAHEVVSALRELRRVLLPGGLLVVKCPDLQAVGSYLVQDSAHVALYASGIGPVSPLDMIYGHRATTALDETMAHKTGFTKTILSNALKQAGFVDIEVKTPDRFELVARAFKENRDAGQIAESTRVLGDPLRAGLDAPPRLCEQGAVA